jgi:asparagine synthase (glutamine-hydrolysing)
MACSVEARLPLVDYRLVEKVIGLRKAHTDVNLPPKAWLKQVLMDFVPEWLLNRPKRGFEPPVREWHGAIFTSHGHQLRDGYLVQSNVLNAASAAKLSNGDFPKGAIIPLSFKALVLELWCRRYSAL